MAERDSLDKIIGTYFAMVCAEPFTYKSKTYQPKTLRVSPGIFRGFTCPAHCGGCCPRFSLDYLPTEERPLGYDTMRWKVRSVIISGESYDVVSDMQLDHDNHHCRNLNMTDGRCGVHGRQPFSCDFELIRFMEFKEPEHPNYLNQKLFGRGWAMLRVDGDRGALCEMTPVTPETIADTIRKLKRLKQWCEYFNVKHKVDSIIAWAEHANEVEALFV